MKKILKYIGLFLGLIVAVVLITGLFVSKDYHFEKSISINAPKVVVWEQVSKLANHEKWSPWKDLDPNMQQSIEGTDGTVGAVAKWKGNKEVGSGSQTIKSLNAPEKVETELHFIEPFDAKADAFIKLQDQGAQTNVTWGFDSKYPYPMNAICLFMNMDKAMDKDFSKGLSKLKNLCETTKSVADSTVSAAQ